MVLCAGDHLLHGAAGHGNVQVLPGGKDACPQTATPLEALVEYKIPQCATRHEGHAFDVEFAAVFNAGPHGGGLVGVLAAKFILQLAHAGEKVIDHGGFLVAS